jgi:hypothetical protein
MDHLEEKLILQWMDKTAQAVIQELLTPELELLQLQQLFLPQDIA